MQESALLHNESTRAFAVWSVEERCSSCSISHRVSTNASDTCNFDSSELLETPCFMKALVLDGGSPADICRNKSNEPNFNRQCVCQFRVLFFFSLFSARSPAFVSKNRAASGLRMKSLNARVRRVVPRCREGPCVGQVLWDGQSRFPLLPLRSATRFMYRPYPTRPIHNERRRRNSLSTLQMLAAPVLEIPSWTLVWVWAAMGSQLTQSPLAASCPASACPAGGEGRAELDQNNLSGKSSICQRPSEST